LIAVISHSDLFLCAEAERLAAAVAAGEIGRPAAASRMRRLAAGLADDGASPLFVRLAGGFADRLESGADLTAKPAALKAFVMRRPDE